MFTITQPIGTLNINDDIHTWGTNVLRVFSLQRVIVTWHEKTAYVHMKSDHIFDLKIKSWQTYRKLTQFLPFTQLSIGNLMPLTDFENLIQYRKYVL